MKILVQIGFIVALWGIREFFSKDGSPYSLIVTYGRLGMVGLALAVVVLAAIFR